MKKTWILKLRPEQQDKVIIVEGDKVWINGLPAIVLKENSRRLSFNDHSSSTTLIIQSNNDQQQQTPQMVQQFDCYVVATDFSLRSFGMDKQLYLNNVNVETGHILNTRRKINLYDIAWLACTYLAFILFGFGILILFPIILFIYFIVWNNRVVIVKEIPRAVVPPSDFLLVNNQQQTPSSPPQQPHQVIQIPPQQIQHQPPTQLTQVYTPQYHTLQPPPPPYMIYQPQPQPQQPPPSSILNYSPYAPYSQMQPQLPLQSNLPSYPFNNIYPPLPQQQQPPSQFVEDKISEKAKLID